MNGTVVNISSYRVKEGDVIEVREKARTIPMVMEAVASAERDVPEFIDVADNGFKVTYLRVPALDEIPYPVQMEPQLVVEFYSR